MNNYWIGVASYDHVKIGVQGRFMQLNHGKKEPLMRIKKNDWVIYYSPRTNINYNDRLQCFSAIGKVVDDNIYQYKMSNSFLPYRRNVRFYTNIKLISILDIKDELEFIDDKIHYGAKLRFGIVKISKKDFDYIGRKLTGK